MLLARSALRLGGWTPKTTRCGFHSLPNSQARGLDAQNYSLLTHVKTGGKKNSTLRATTF